MLKLFIFLKLLTYYLKPSIQNNDEFFLTINNLIFFYDNEIKTYKNNLYEKNELLKNVDEIYNEIKNNEISLNINYSAENLKSMEAEIEKSLQDEENKFSIFKKNKLKQYKIKSKIKLLNLKKYNILKRVNMFLTNENQFYNTNIEQKNKYKRKIETINLEECIKNNESKLTDYKKCFEGEKLTLNYVIEKLSKIKSIQSKKYIIKLNNLINDKESFIKEYCVFLENFKKINYCNVILYEELKLKNENLITTSEKMIETYQLLKNKVRIFYNKKIKQYTLKKN